MVGASTSGKTFICLAGPHAYGVLGTYTVTDKTTGNGINLVQVRNPWGFDDTCFNGTWKDGNAIWDTVDYSNTPYVKDASDGVLWVNMTEFVGSFSYIQVGLYDETF